MVVWLWIKIQDQVIQTNGNSRKQTEKGRQTDSWHNWSPSMTEWLRVISSCNSLPRHWLMFDWGLLAAVLCSHGLPAHIRTGSSWCSILGRSSITKVTRKAQALSLLLLFFKSDEERERRESTPPLTPCLSLSCTSCSLLLLLQY